jgi:methionyl-tRNA formyltransferase
MDFAGRTAHETYNRWRGFQPWPGAFTTLDGKKLIVHRMAPVETADISNLRRRSRGRFTQIGPAVCSACAAESWIELLEVQLEGKKRLSAAEFLRGTAIAEGARFGERTS